MKHFCRNCMFLGDKLCILHNRKATPKTYITCPDFREKVFHPDTESGSGGNPIEIQVTMPPLRTAFSAAQHNKAGTSRLAHPVTPRLKHLSEITNVTKSSHDSSMEQRNSGMRQIINSSSVSIEKYLSLSDSFLDLQKKVIFIEQEIQFVLRYVESFWPGDVTARDTLLVRLKSLLSITESKIE